jgi:starch phosphorylase
VLAGALWLPLIPGLPMVARSAPPHGYFRQRLDLRVINWRAGVWVPEEVLEPMSPRVTIAIEGRSVRHVLGAMSCAGCSGAVPVYLLDTALERTSPGIVPHGSSMAVKPLSLCQEVVLGIGGVMMLAALGYDRLQPYH